MASSSISSSVIKRMLSTAVNINRSSAAAPVRLDALRTELRQNLRDTELAYLYTYPTKSSFGSFTDRNAALQSWRGYSGHINLYTHIPFCAQKCGFCNLYTVTLGDRDVKAAAASPPPTLPLTTAAVAAAAGVTGVTTGGAAAAASGAPVWSFNSSSPTDVSRYAAAIIKEFDIFRSVMDQRNVKYDSIHFGGGTPTLMPITHLSSMLQYFKSKFPLAPGAEVAIEAAPASVLMHNGQPYTANTDEPSSYLRDLVAAGFTRLSLGAQSLEEKELIRIGRGKEIGMAQRAVRQALKAGFVNVNVDLIYGMPVQTDESFLHSVRAVVELGVQTVTLYPLTVRRRAPLGKQGVTRDVPRMRDLHDRAVAILKAGGFEQKTLVLFSRTGGGNRFEEAEFEDVPTLGLGAGSRNYTHSMHFSNDDYFSPKASGRILMDYLAAVESGSPAVRCAVTLTDDDHIRRFVILNLIYKGLDRQAFARQFPRAPAFDQLFADELQVGVSEGLLIDNGRTIRLAPHAMPDSMAISLLFSSPKMKTDIGNDYV